MADFDPCECVFSHESAMRRLLSLLRNSQGYCTDAECVSELPGPAGGDGLFNGGHGMFYMMTLWVVMALALFFLRPRALRSTPDYKPGPSSSRSNDPDQPVSFFLRPRALRSTPDSKPGPSSSRSNDPDQPVSFFLRPRALRSTPDSKPGPSSSRSNDPDQPVSFFLRPRALRSTPDSKPGPSSSRSNDPDQPGPSNQPPPPPVA